MKEGNGSSNAVRLVANGDSTFAYGSASTMLQLAAQGAPVISVAEIDAEGTDAVLVNPDSGIKTFKDLEGKEVLTTAGAGVNTFFPVAAENAGVDVSKIHLVNVAESALVSSYLHGMAPALLGGIDDKPAEIEANGGKPPIAFNYTDYGVYQPGYAIVASQDMVKKNPDLVRRFVKATLEAVKAAQADPDASIAALIKANPGTAQQKDQARKVLDVTLSILISPNNKDKQLGLNVPADWASALALLKKYKGTRDRHARDRLLYERVHPDLGRLRRRKPSRGAGAGERRRRASRRQQGLRVGGGRGPRLRPDRPRRGARGVRLGPRPLRLRQEHAAPHGGRPSERQRG